MQTTAEFTKKSTANICLMLAIQTLSDLISKRPSLFLFLILNKSFINFFGRSLFHFLQLQFIILFTIATSQQCSRSKSRVEQSSYSENTQKTKLRQFFLPCWRMKDSVINGTGLHQGDFFEKLEVENLAKVSFLKLQTKENLLGCFHQLATYYKWTPTLMISRISFQLRTSITATKSDQIRQQVNILNHFHF